MTSASDSSDDDVARMRVTIFLTLDRAGRVKAEVQEVKASRSTTQQRRTL
jgi:hypothetical protein